MLIQEHVGLAPLTTLGVGGPARYFCEARDENDIRDAMAFARERDLPVFVLGGGSNLVVSRPGLSGSGAEDRAARLRISRRSMTRRLRSLRGAGDDWDGLVAPHRRSKLRRAGVSERHSRHGRRHSGAECRRLRAGGRGDHHRGARACIWSRGRCHLSQRRVPVCLSLQHLQYVVAGSYTVLQSRIHSYRPTASRRSLC